MFIQFKCTSKHLISWQQGWQSIHYYLPFQWLQLVINFLPCLLYKYESAVEKRITHRKLIERIILGSRHPITSLTTHRTSLLHDTVLSQLLL
jgi:hypothetical protein